MRNADITLTRALKALGFTHRKAETGHQYAHDIIDPGGQVVFSGTADEVWQWLRRGPDQ